MTRVDITASKISRHFLTFSVFDEGLGGDDVFLCGFTLSMNALFGKKSHKLQYIPGYINCGANFAIPVRLSKYH